MEDQKKGAAHGDILPPPIWGQNLEGSRHSYSSSYSNLSYDAEVEEAVAMPMASQGEAQMKPMPMDSVAGSIRSADEKASLFSDSSVQLGRLDTIKKSTSPARPEITLETSLDAVVPPRSRRRPVSELIPGPHMGKPRHKQHNSLNISEDLDKLMASATGLQLEPERARARTQPSSPERKSVGRSSAPHHQISSDSFQTADEELVPSSPESGSSAMKLPRRPTQDNMARARQASLKKLGPEDDDASDAVSVSTWQGRAASVHTRQASLSRNRTVTAADESLRKIPSSSSRYVSSEDVSLAAEAKHSPALSAAGARKPSKASSAGPYLASALQSTSSFHVQDETMVVKPPVVARDGSPQKSIRHKDSPEMCSPAASARGAAGGGSPGCETRAPREAPDHSGAAPAPDDGYYDVDEPVVVSQPARAKSVRDHTRDPAKGRRKRRGKPRATDRGSQLRPFSYNTLVHLLESVNGTVIGQEFEELNLPVQEKQLIEKVIDSLSRLTSDMAVDKNRYDVGMQRLEKAHRVLEGFL